jgi:hypothetical protein
MSRSTSAASPRARASARAAPRPGPRPPRRRAPSPPARHGDEREGAQTGAERSGADERQRRRRARAPPQHVARVERAAGEPREHGAAERQRQPGPGDGQHVQRRELRRAAPGEVHHGGGQPEVERGEPGGERQPRAGAARLPQLGPPQRRARHDGREREGERGDARVGGGRPVPGPHGGGEDGRRDRHARDVRPPPHAPRVEYGRGRLGGDGRPRVGERGARAPGPAGGP